MIQQSEFKGLMAQMEKRGNEGMRPLLLKMANGTDREGYSHQTLSSLSCDIRKCCACLTSAVQDDVLNSYLSGVRKGSVDNDGFLQRFLYFFVTPSGQRMIVRDSEPDYSEIQNKHWLAYNLDKDIEVSFNEEAVSLFIDYEFITSQNRLNKTTDSALESLQAKYNGVLGKIAYIYAFMHSPSGKMPKEITKIDVERAIEFIEWQRSAMESFWYNSDTSMLFRTAQRFLEDMKMMTVKSGVTITEVKKNYRDIDITTLKKVLKILEDRNWVRVEFVGAEYSIFFNPEAI